MARFFSQRSNGRRDLHLVCSMVLQGLNRSLPRAMSNRALSFVRSCILSIHLGAPHFWQRVEPKANYTRMTYRHISTADLQMLIWLVGKWVFLWTVWSRGCYPIAYVPKSRKDLIHVFGHYTAACQASL